MNRSIWILPEISGFSIQMVSADDVTVQHFYVVHLFLEFHKMFPGVTQDVTFFENMLAIKILSINFNNKDVVSYKLMYIHRLLTEKYSGLRY